MKITKRQLRRIIKEERANLIREMNPDGTISDDEDVQREGLLAEVERTMLNLVEDVAIQAEHIGGSFRSPGIKAECFKLMADIIHNAR
jgi:hypothetical protein